MNQQKCSMNLLVSGYKEVPNTTPSGVFIRAVHSDKERVMQYTIVNGNLCDGFTFHGPFHSFDEADEYIHKHSWLQEPNWIATLLQPIQDEGESNG